MPMMRNLSLAAVIAAGTLLSGCATKESVEHAQATADLASSDARAAHGAADRAQASADGAGKTAGDALALAQTANDKIDKYIADQERRREAAKEHRRHRRHVAAASNYNCPTPNQQKSELKKKTKTAAADKALQISPQHANLTTARN